jgi:general stress protein 26
MPRRPHDPDDLKRAILALLDECRVMAVATIRPDGWPQTTLVGFVHDGLDLYFGVARDSQKLANINRDERVSIALGRERADHIQGLSMAARAHEIADMNEVARLNDLILDRYPEQVVFAPREASVAVIRAKPWLVSFIDQGKGPGEPVLAEVAGEAIVLAASPSSRPG